MSHMYPLLFAFAGLLVGALLSERAMATLPTVEKGAVMEAFSRVRRMNLFAVVAFILLMLWRPTFAWAFLFFAYIALAFYSVPSFRRLDVPRAIKNRLLTGQILAILGITACAGIFLVRALA
jgi:hypothetical protein